MTTSLPEDMLRELWSHYGRWPRPIEEQFRCGLDWALKPVHRSVAIVASTEDGYQAYDWIVSYADTAVEREINPVVWDRVLDIAEPDVGLQLGVAAERRGDWRRAVRAWVQAQDSTNPYVAAAAAFNCAVVLERQGDLEGACGAYERAVESGHAEVAPMAAFNLGVARKSQRDFDGARAAYQRAIDSGHSDASPKAALNLGNLLSQQGEIGAARAAYQQAIDSGNAEYAPDAALNLGNMLIE